jgi:UDP-2,3-diacylglucosamine pyrophosphatase LpxH
MLSLDDFLEKTRDNIQVYNNYRLKAENDLTSKLTLCIPDMHLLERGRNDDFLDNKPEYEERFLGLLDFIVQLKEEEGSDCEVVQLGDMFDLWQAKGNTNLIYSAYPSILGLLEKTDPIYVIGNHDIDIVKYHEDKGETFGRKWRHFSLVDGNRRAIFEHGFQADMANNQDSWTGALGLGVTKIVGVMEYIEPDIDVHLVSIWNDIVSSISRFNDGFTPAKSPRGIDQHIYQKYYVDLMEKYNRGETPEQPGTGNTDLALAVIGHTHTAKLEETTQGDNTYYLMDCGSWVNGGHEIGVISGQDIAVCQWG